MLAHAEVAAVAIWHTFTEYTRAERSPWTASRKASIHQHNRPAGTHTCDEKGNNMREHTCGNWLKWQPKRNQWPTSRGTC